MVSEERNVSEKSPITRMQPFEELIKTPSEGVSKTGTTNAPSTVEKLTVEGGNPGEVIRGKEDDTTIKDFEAFKKFQIAQEKHKRTNEKKAIVIDEDLLR